MVHVQQVLDDIALAVRRIYREAVDPVSAKYAFEQRPSEGEIAGPPTVLLLGNHSSGKSTFVNFLLGAAVQKTGLAPTDDAFTILAAGPSDEERDGEALTSNPDLPYAGLRHFGPSLLSHLRLKRRALPLLREVTLVDSPGMIDAASPESGRGYDFAGAVRWFAERADVVVFFFDPDKPGTTGETLQVFTQALSGLDHKILIVMNKMDLFRTLPDFARAYGALCWNLGKVIPRKDLPHVYTTFVPVDGAPPPALPAADFALAREELVGEIRRAPARRADNMLTQVERHARRLEAQARVLEAATRELRGFRSKLLALLLLVLLVGGLAGAISILAGAETWVTAAAFGGAAVLGYVGALVIRALVRGEEQRIVAGLKGVFEKAYAHELLTRERAADLWTLWEGVQSNARRAAEQLGLLSFRRLRAAERERLRHALDVEIPGLRAKLHRELENPAPVTPG
jgi:hypothetical protein